MKTLQLIDSLRPGGAEKMAVLYANALAIETNGSYLCCTRLEGLLKETLVPEVGYLFLEKKSTWDFKAFWKLRNFVKREGISIIQAHSDSFFLAVMVKWSLPGVKVVWHDHYGRELKKRKAGALTFFSKEFDAIISVNEGLAAWARKKLHAKKVLFLPNFLPTKPNLPQNEILKGKGTFKVICVANMRRQKDHFTLVEAFYQLYLEHKKVSLHLIGKGEDLEYETAIKNEIRKKKLENHVFFYGESPNVENFLKDAHLGVLSSLSEGLPLALLEYGKAGLPVVCTRVGQCAKVIESYGKLVPAKNSNALKNAIISYIEQPKIRALDAAHFKEKVMQNYCQENVVPKALELFYGIVKSQKQ